MTDQLEHDLRTLLTERAATVSADPVSGERAIANRLLTGEAPVEAASGQRVTPTGVWLVRAAAVALIAVVAAGALLARGQDGPDSRSSPTTLLPVGSQGSRLTLAGVEDAVDCSLANTDERVLVLPTGECVRIGSTVRGDLVIGSATAQPNVPDPDSHDLWNVHITFSDGGRSLTRGLALECSQRESGCGDGRIVVLIDQIIVDVQRSTGPDAFEGDRLMLPPDVPEVEARTLARDLNASIDNPPPDVIIEDYVDYTLGDPDDAAKDVAERLMRELLGDESVTMSVSEPGTGVREVTMETSTGAEVVATVVFDDAAGAFRVTGVASPGLSAEVTPDDELFAELPVGGTLRVRGFTEDFGSEIDATPGDGVALEAGRQGPLAQPPDDHVWLVLRLEADDGQVLWSFSRR